MKTPAIVALAAAITTVSFSIVAEARPLSNNDFRAERYIGIVLFQPHCPSIRIIKYDLDRDNMLNVTRPCR